MEEIETPDSPPPIDGRARGRWRRRLYRWIAGVYLLLAIISLVLFLRGLAEGREIGEPQSVSAALIPLAFFVLAAWMFVRGR
jgi:uncharacterized membrane protein YhaH (DUF805 family)